GETYEKREISASLASTMLSGTTSHPWPSSMSQYEVAFILLIGSREQYSPPLAPRHGLLRGTTRTRGLALFRLRGRRCDAPGRALALAHQVEVVAGGFLTNERPVVVVVAKRRRDEEPAR